MYEQRWSTLNNGDLLAAAERAGYDRFMKTDQTLRYQQNLTGRRLAILVLKTTSWPKIRQHIARVQSTVDAMGESSYLDLSFD